MGTFQVEQGYSLHLLPARDDTQTGKWLPGSPPSCEIMRPPPSEPSLPRSGGGDKQSQRARSSVLQCRGGTAQGGVLSGHCGCPGRSQKEGPTAQSGDRHQTPCSSYLSMARLLSSQNTSFLRQLSGNWGITYCLAFGRPWPQIIQCHIKKQIKHENSCEGELFPRPCHLRKGLL